MKVSEVKIEIVKPNDGLIGFASVLIDDMLYLSSIAVHKKLNSDGYRLTYPKKGKFDIFHPISVEASSAIEIAIFNKLDILIKKGLLYV